MDGNGRRWRDGQMDEWMNGWIDMDRWMGGGVGGWMDVGGRYG